MATRFHTRTDLALAFTAAVIMAALSGCSSDDYYCDSNGCYSCDGVGCSPVVPPTRATCAGDYACPASQVCTDLGCATSCTNEADCARGWICRGASAGVRGICVAPSENPTRRPGACMTNANCSNGTTCVDGVCTRPACTAGASGCACGPDGQCASGTVCVGGTCTVSTNTCQFNSQCGSGRVCVNQRCQASCTTTSCPVGQTCQSGVCIDTAGSACVRDTECGANRRCINGTCYTRCTTSPECGTGLYCSEQGVCAPDTRRHPFCTTDTQCAMGSRCLDGVCRRPCTTQDDCLRTDVSYRNCAPIAYLHTTESFCQTDHEYRPTCARATECTTGQSCVDGTCQTLR